MSTMTAETLIRDFSDADIPAAALARATVTKQDHWITVCLDGKRIVSTFSPTMAAQILDELVDHVVVLRSRHPADDPIADLVALQMLCMPPECSTSSELSERWKASFLPAFVDSGTLPDDPAKLRYLAGFEGYTVGRIERDHGKRMADRAAEVSLIRFPADCRDAIEIGIAAGRAAMAGTYRPGETIQ